MSYSHQLHPLIRQDYDEAYKWYEDQQKGLGERFIKAVRQSIEQIVLHPETYGSRSNKKFREAKVDFFPYVIVYKINKRTRIIYISSIQHTNKHFSKPNPEHFQSQILEQFEKRWKEMKRKFILSGFAMPNLPLATGEEFSVSGSAI